MPLLNTKLAASDIPEGSSKSLDLSAGTFFAIRKGGELFIYHNHCPHLGIALNWQADQFLDSEGSLIQCATHGALFVIESGQCVSGPCLGKQLQSVEYCIEAGLLQLQLPD